MNMERISKQSKNDKKKEEVILACLFSLFLLILTTSVIAVPTGPTSIVVENDTTKQTTDGLMVNISGGYIAKLNISASVQNPNWKAFIGDISGSFTLDDASGSTIYNWSAGAADGEIYATRQSGSVQWTTITCATAGEITVEELALEHDGSDNITSTFSAGSNQNIYTIGSNPQITATQCYALNTFVSSNPQATDFEEIILHDESNIIYVTQIEAGGKTGYDGGDYDFQMLIPENASAGSAQIPYYVYVELN